MKYRSAILALLLIGGMLPNLHGEGRPNILLILSDDHSLPHLVAYGCENCRRFGITPTSVVS